MEEDTSGRMSVSRISELAGVFVNFVASLFSRCNLYLIRFVPTTSGIFVTHLSVWPDAKDSNVTSHMQLLVLRVIRKRTHDFCRHIPTMVVPCRAGDAQSEGIIVIR